MTNALVSSHIQSFASVVSHFPVLTSQRVNSQGRWWLTVSHLLQLGVGIIGAPERRPTQGQLPPPWKPTSLSPMCQKGRVILIKILYLPVNRESLHHTMASVLLIDQKTFKKKRKGTESDVTVPAAIKAECLWEQLLHWDHVCSGVVKHTLNLWVRFHTISFNCNWDRKSVHQ